MGDRDRRRRPLGHRRRRPRRGARARSSSGPRRRAIPGCGSPTSRRWPTWPIDTTPGWSSTTRSRRRTCRPRSRSGADVVMHSTTKYLGGHSDAIGGMLVTNDAELSARLKFFQYAVGAIPGPLDCYLIMRGIRTLAVRMDRHQENAAQGRRDALDHDQDRTRLVPGPGDPPEPQGRARSDARLRRHGERRGRGRCGAATAFVEKTTVFTLAESLGGVESLIESRPR